MSFEVLTTAEAAQNAHLGKGIGPRYIKTPGVTGKVLYDPADIKAWREAHRSGCTATAE